MQGYAELGDAGADQLLARERHAVLATLARDGAPHLVPIVYAGDSSELWFAIDGKPKRGPRLARLAHIERDARVTVLIDGYDEDWSQLYWLRLEGRASVEQRDTPAARAALQALHRRYPQYAAVGTGSDSDALVRISVLRRVAWCAQTWAGVLDR